MIETLDKDTFAGVTVVDLTRLLPGPFATMLLCDLGARVIKVEPPQGGDYARWTPPMVTTVDGGYGAFFEALNRGKQSVSADLKTEAGRDFVRRLVVNADVVIESFRPGVMERLGFGIDELRRLNGRLIVCSISSYGQTGPMATRAGHDLNFLARSGALGLIGPTDRAPAIPAVQIGDLAGGALYAAFATAAALFRRERTAVGAQLDISMTEGVLSLLGPALNSFAAGSAPPRGQDTLTGGLPCYRVYRTMDDGFLAVGALEPKFWASFCNAIGHPEWSGDGLAFGDDGERVAARVQSVIETRTQQEWADTFAGVDACVEPVLTLAQVVEDAHLVARGVVRRSTEGRLLAVAPTSRARLDLAVRVPPLLGEHTASIAREVGLDDAAIEDALAVGAFAMNSRA